MTPWSWERVAMPGEPVLVVQSGEVAFREGFGGRLLGWPAARAARLRGRVMFLYLFRSGYRMKGDAQCVMKGDAQCVRFTSSA